VRLTVSDTGQGMDSATMQRIFEPFFTTKPVGEGTGLGLAVAHGIMQAHEGKILVRSELGKGTTFELYFPVATADAERVELPRARSEPGPGRAEHILYIDDDEAMVYLIERLLTRRGYRVSAFTQPREALAALRSDPSRFDLVVTDFNMPDLSGLDVARVVRELRPELPVAVTSGFITEELRALAPPAGVHELLFKPDTVEELCDMVQRLLGRAGSKATA
jgi:CheY-like chemotaxis protein